MAEFAVLGVLRVWEGRHEVPVPAGKLRTLLCGLISRADETVPTATLARWLWDDGEPANPKAAIQTYVRRLRDILGDERIRTDIGGYQFVADAIELDLAEFDDLFTKAREADRRGAGHDVVAMLDQALSLRRGRAFGDVDGEAALREFVWPCEERVLAAYRLLISWRLRHGEHADVLPELSRLTGQYPLHEGLAELIMLALYRTGRQADALARYETLRLRLAEELGADPGVALQDLHRRILNLDPTLNAPEKDPGSAHSIVPRQLPARRLVLTGREQDLAVLTKVLSPATGRGDGPPITIVTGVGGIGKTALSLLWAHEHADEFPDGQLYLNLRGFDPAGEPLEPQACLRRVLRDLGVAASAIPSDLDALAALYRSQLADKRVLMLLDDVRDSAQVIPLLPGTDSVAVLITSRNRLGGLTAGYGANTLILDVLPPAAARTMLTRHIGDDRVRRESEAADELVSRCAGLPLALSVMAARAAAHPEFPLETLAHDLRDEAGRLDALDLGELPASLRAVFATSYRALDRGPARTFALLGVAPVPDFTADAVATLINRSVVSAASDLRALEAANVVRQHAPRRYRMHDLVRLYATELASGLTSHLQRQEGLLRLMDHYRYAAAIAADLLDPVEPYRRPPVPEPIESAPALPDQDAARAWLDRECATLLAAGLYTARSGMPDHAAHLSSTLMRYLDYSGRYHDALELHSAAMEAVREHDPGAYHRTMWNRAYALVRLGDYSHAQSLGQSVLDFASRTDDLVLGTSASMLLAVISDKLRRSDEQLHHIENALDMARRSGHPSEEGTALLNLAYYHEENGDYEAALEALDQAGNAVRDVPEAGLDNWLLSARATVYERLGRCQDAFENYRQALVIARARANLGLQVEVLNRLGGTARILGYQEEAISNYLEAITLARNTGFRHEEARGRGGLAQVYRDLQRPADAAHHAEKAIALHAELGSLPSSELRGIAGAPGE
ncbi:BTAD domain-containing putative transcriptional regulator [Amycolatopsis sp. EV170708-02-1]|uniref:AfsR/SARP family transcriptional regulator n=1 Tax=Amycolatopsis sp. EV170708-02-1 TaxID=2919322 RepID=UPI001F0BFD38|nr:BTAD domain-containing putative transcriptional regulator [Amycolatopsis sp. EV170708-02-1]UMP00099.1 tetratricopeptide repeat protein [Amycolatopsis sp. EV170708-02-1]